MAGRRGSLSPYCLFVRDLLPQLQRRGLPVSRVVDAIPYCSQAWALLTKEEKGVYTEKVRKWNERKRSQKAVEEMCNLAHPVPSCVTTEMPSVTSFPDASSMSWENDQAVVTDIFYFVNIYSHGKLPSHCEQRFLPCEIGCVRYSLQDGIMADFHHFIDPEVPPRGFRYHCQAASDATHKIPVSGFHLSRTCYTVVLRELLEFAQPARGVWPHFYCRSNDRFRINWCLNRMASLTGIESRLELLTVEDLLTKLYQKKYQKMPSKNWVYGELDVFLWNFSSNTSQVYSVSMSILTLEGDLNKNGKMYLKHTFGKCEWHEENDILWCALASCKKIAYCISKSLSSMYGVSLTAAHMPLQDCDYGESGNTKMVMLDAGCFQEVEAEGSGCDRHFASPSQDQEFFF